MLLLALLLIELDFSSYEESLGRLLDILGVLFELVFLLRVYSGISSK